MTRDDLLCLSCAISFQQDPTEETCRLVFGVLKPPEPPIYITVSNEDDAGEWIERIPSEEFYACDVCREDVSKGTRCAIRTFYHAELPRPDLWESDYLEIERVSTFNE